MTKRGAIENFDGAQVAGQLMLEFVSSGLNLRAAQLNAGALLFFKLLSEHRGSPDVPRSARGLPTGFTWEDMRELSDDDFGTNFLERVVPYLASYGGAQSVRTFFAQRFVGASPASIGRARRRLDRIRLTALPLEERQRLMEGLVAADGIARSGLGETSAPARRIMSFYARISNGQRVLDLGCGTGALLAEAAIAASRSGEATPDIDVHGVDVSETDVAFAHLRLALLGLYDAELRLSDVSDLGFQQWLSQEKFDVVFADPPLGSALKGLGLAPDGRIRLFPSPTPEAVFTVLAAEALAPGGVAAVLVPHAFLFRADLGTRTIREDLVRRYGLRRVIGVPSGFFAGANIRGAILIFHGRSAAQAEQIWFHSVAPGVVARISLTATASIIEEWVAAEERHEASSGSFSVAIDALERADWSLDPGFYAPEHKPSRPSWQVLHAEALERLAKAESALRALSQVSYEVRDHRPLHEVVKRMHANESSIGAPPSWLVTPADIEPISGRILRRRSIADSREGVHRVQFEAGDLLFLRLNPGLGKVIVADRPGFATSDFVVLQVIDERSTPGEYLAAVMRSEPFRRVAERTARGSTLKRISVEDLLRCEVPLATPAAAQRWLERNRQADEATRELNEAIARLADLSAADADALFGGTRRAHPGKGRLPNA